MHLEQTRNTLFLVGTGVEHVRAGNNIARVDAEEGQTAYIGVGSDLEGQGAHRSLGRGFAGLDLFGVVDSVAFNGAGVNGAGQVSTDVVEQALHALVLEGGAAGHGHDLHLEGSCAEGTADFIFGDGGGVVEVFLHQSVVVLGDFLQHLVAPLLGLGLESGGNLLHGVFGAHGLVMPEDSLHGDEVNEAFECLFGTDRYLDGAGICTEHILHLAYNLEEVGAGTVHLVNVAQTGHVVFVGLTPHGLRLGLNAAYGAEGSHSTVEHTERALYLNGKVHVPRSVNQVDFVFVAGILPEGSGGGGGDCDTTLLLLLHPVHGGGAVMNLTDLVGKAGVEENTLRRCGLAGIDVGHDTEVARIF